MTYIMNVNDESFSSVFSCLGLEDYMESDLKHSGDLQIPDFHSNSSNTQEKFKDYLQSRANHDAIYDAKSNPSNIRNQCCPSKEKNEPYVQLKLQHLQSKPLEMFEKKNHNKIQIYNNGLKVNNRDTKTNLGSNSCQLFPQQYWNSSFNINMQSHGYLKNSTNYPNHLINQSVSSPPILYGPQNYLYTNNKGVEASIRPILPINSISSNALVGYIRELYISGCLIKYICSSSLSLVMLKNFTKLKEDSANYLLDVLYSINGIYVTMTHKNALPIFKLMISRVSMDRRRKVLALLYDTFQVLAIDINGSKSVQILLETLTIKSEIELFIDILTGNQMLSLFCLNIHGSLIVIKSLILFNLKDRVKLNDQLISNLNVLLTQNQFGVSVVS